jgi:hypothetical protein
MTVMLAAAVVLVAELAPEEQVLQPIIVRPMVGFPRFKGAVMPMVPLLLEAKVVEATYTAPMVGVPNTAVVQVVEAMIQVGQPLGMVAVVSSQQGEVVVEEVPKLVTLVEGVVPGVHML